MLSQPVNLRTHPAVVRALGQKKVTLHGWVYDLGSGSVQALDTDSGRLVVLAE